MDEWIESKATKKQYWTGEQLVLLSMFYHSRAKLNYFHFDAEKIQLSYP
jgi:hypothetical protein